MHTTKTITITADETLNELVARAPAALPALQRLGLDTCCGGGLTLAVVAEHHGLDLAELLGTLRAALVETPDRRQ
jgi:iron-sulfur cluster repair protein YtfE (RIC family)